MTAAPTPSSDARISRGATAAIVAALVLPVCFAGPLRVFLRNASDFPVPASTVAGAALLVSAVAFVPLYLAARLWPRVMVPLLAWLAIVAFAESSIFLALAGHRPFDGQPIEWATWRTLSIVELATAAAVALAVFWWRGRLRVWHSVAVAILAWSAIGLGAAAWDRREVFRSHAGSLSHAYFDQFHRLSPTRNVIHVVADTMQGSLVRDIIQSDAGRYEMLLDGFTLFADAMGHYPSTFASVPYYMTGRAPAGPDGDVPSVPFTWDYVRQTLADHSVVGALAARGYRTFGYQVSPLYCSGKYSACQAGPVFDGRALEESGRYASLRQIADVALFQTSPLVLRQRIYDNGDWFLAGGRRRPRAYSGILDVFLERISNDASAPTYNYFHLAGGHGPLRFDEACNYIGVQPLTPANQRRQVTCALRQVERLLHALRELGVYDQTMIVVHGDHGTPEMPHQTTGAARAMVPAYVIGSASTMLLVKPIGARGRMRVSQAPAAIGDIPATLSDALGLGVEFPGVSLLRLDTSPRTREFVFYEQWERVASMQALRNPRRYVVGPGVLDERNWTRATTAAASGTPSRLWMDDPRFEQFATGFGALEVQERPARWITNTVARVRLASAPKSAAQVVIECFVPEVIRGQSATIAVNGTVVGRLDAAALSQSASHAFPIPRSVLKQPEHVVEVRMGKIFRPRADSRSLAMVVAYVGIEPRIERGRGGR